MSESDLDKDLKNLMDDADAGGSGDDLSLDDDLSSLADDAGGADAGAGSGDDSSEMSLDDDLAAMADSGAGSKDAGGEGVSMDDDLAAMMKEAGGGEAGADAGGASMSMDDDLSSMMEQSGGGAKPQAKAETGVSPVALAKQQLGPAKSINLDFLLDIKLDVTFEVGRSKMLISDLLSLGQGSVIELHRLVGDELDLMVNGKLIAKGEVIVVNEKFGCKITEIVSPEDRVKHIAGM